MSTSLKLVLTSPPYPGVHVLYHRWQVGGRKETPAPYYLAGLRDGHYASYYTMGSRTPSGLENYFAELEMAFGLLRQILDPRAIVVQLVGFSDPKKQLPAYMGAMKSAGYHPVGPSHDGAVYAPVRRVPNRKWYAQTGAANRPAGLEHLICHSPVS